MWGRILSSEKRGGQKIEPTTIIFTCAIRYLKTGDFNIKSDVWSNGVVLWDIFMVGDPEERYNLGLLSLKSMLGGNLIDDTPRFINKYISVQDFLSSLYGGIW